MYIKYNNCLTSHLKKMDQLFLENTLHSNGYGEV